MNTAQTGTRGLPAIIGLGAALDFFNKLGKLTVANRLAELRTRLCEQLSRLAAVKIVSPPAGPFASPMVSVELPATIDNAAVVEALGRRHNVIVKAVPAGLINAGRISPHLYNSAEDIAMLMTAFEKELKPKETQRFLTAFGMTD